MWHLCGVYVPHFNQMADPAVTTFLDAVGAAELVTTGPDGYPLATLLPLVHHGDRLVLHMARANPHWRAIGPDTPALAVVTGSQAYVSPAWYAAKAEHGRVVPTWNYSSVHLTGRATVHDDQEWLRDAVTQLTEQHEQHRPDPWSVTDAPAAYLDKQLRAIVGIELVIERVEAKAKLSQNRSAEDRSGVVGGLEREGGPESQSVAEAMRRLR